MLKILREVRAMLSIPVCIFNFREGASITRFVGRSVGRSVSRKKLKCLKMASLDNHMINSHRCEEGGALTPYKDESRGKILCFRVQVHVKPRTNLAIWLDDKNTVKQPQYK